MCKLFTKFIIAYKVHMVPALFFCTLYDDVADICAKFKKNLGCSLSAMNLQSSKHATTYINLKLYKL
jgi:hypothetical protein